MDESLTEQHPLLALLVGFVIVACAFLWLRYSDQYERWVISKTGMRYPSLMDTPAYKFLTVSVGGCFILAVGVTVIVASIVEIIT